MCFVRHIVSKFVDAHIFPAFKPVREGAREKATKNVRQGRGSLGGCRGALHRISE